MNRTEITIALTKITERFITGRAGLFAHEVVFDYGSADVKRADIVAFYPVNDRLKGIESGDFVCYEVKSCKEDFNSGFGRNAVGDANYFVMTAQTYLECNRELLKLRDFGVYVAIPDCYIAKFTNKDTEKWLLNPTPFEGDWTRWKLCKIAECEFTERKRSNLHMMYLMLKSKCHGR